MGAQASTLDSAGTDSSDPANDANAFRRAWREGVPFTLLHDEAFVNERYQEITAGKLLSTNASERDSEIDSNAAPLISGTNGVPMDELQQVADLARIKLFSKRRTTQLPGTTGQRVRASSNSASGTSTSTSTSAQDAAADSDSAASVLAAATADKILSRESAESVASERLRRQRVAIVEHYYTQLAKRLDAINEPLDTSTSIDAVTNASTPTTAIVTAPPRVNPLANWSGAPSSVFTVGSFRVQLEMLREFRVAMPRLFEHSVVALIETLLDFPPFALQTTALGATEQALLADAHAFCQSVLDTSDSDNRSELTESHRQVTLLLLLAFGVSSGCASLLLDFTQRLVLGSQSPVRGSAATLLLRNQSIASWSESLLARLESYRVDVTLGSFEDSTLVTQFPVKLVHVADASSSSAATDKLPNAQAIATDGSFVYAWSATVGLLKIGTGLNFTIAGRVYAESSVLTITQGFQRTRTFRAALAGTGRNVTETVRAELRKRPSTSDEASRTRVSDVLVTGGLDDILSSFITRRLFVMYAVDDAEATAILTDDDDFADLHTRMVQLGPNVADTNDANAHTGNNVQVLAAFYGDFDVLHDDALDCLRRRFEIPSASANDRDDDNGDTMVTVTLPLLADLLADTTIADNVTDTTELVLFYSTDSSAEIVCSSFYVGDQIAAVDDKRDAVYMSSLVLCGDSLYLSLMCSSSDRISVANPKPLPRRMPRRLIRISLQDLSVVSIRTLQRDASSQTADAPQATTYKPLVTYISEGRRIYEIEMTASSFHVQAFALETSVSGLFEVISSGESITIDIDSIRCTYFVSFFITFLTHELGATDSVALPMLYTNGKWLAIVVPASTGKSHGVMFDLEKQLFVGDANVTTDANGARASSPSKCLESAVPGRLACFDAKNNVLWALDNGKGSLAYYRNPGLRISLSQSVASSSVLNQAVCMEADHHSESNAAGVTLPSRSSVSFEAIVCTRVLGFLSENAETSEPDEWAALGGTSIADTTTAAVPFVADLRPTSFASLLRLLRHFVTQCKPASATNVERYNLQACLSIMNAHVTLLLRVKRDERVNTLQTLLRDELSPLLHDLIHSSHNANHNARAEQIETRIATSDESGRAKLAVISKALDLYATCIHIFHPDVVQQFSGVLVYLMAWETGRASAMELQIVARLLGHLSTRVNDLQCAILASKDAMKTFTRVVHSAVVLQKQRLATIFADAGASDKSSTRTLEDSDALRELTLFVNSVSQSLLLLLRSPSSRAHHDDAMQHVRTVFALFHILSDGCSDVCAATAAHIQATPPSRSTWSRAEKALRRGFFGVVSPMLFASALAFVRNLEPMMNTLVLDASDESDDASSSKRTLFDFLQANATKMATLLTSIKTVSAAVDPSARQRTVGSVVVESKCVTMESLHEYENDMDELKELRIPGAMRIVVTFDPRSRTELNYDYVTFYKDKLKRACYGEQTYSGRDDEYNWPGVGAQPPLMIESDHCFVMFHSDSSNTDWGYKFTARGEMLTKKSSIQRHWLVYLAESIAHVLDESIAVFVSGSTFAPIVDVEFQHERFLQSDLVKGGFCAQQTQNTNVLELLRAFTHPTPNSRAEKVVHALMHRSGTLRQRSSSFASTTESSGNQSVNSAVRTVAASILHHNMWGMDAYAFAEDLRSDVSDQLLRGWKNAQKMRDWFHLGDAAEASMQRPASPSRRGKLRRQPSAFKGISEESLEILCANVIERAQFLLELTPASFSYVSGAKRRWGLLAKYGSAIGKTGSSESTIDKWYNLLDELQAATALRSLFQYRRNSSERMRGGQAKSVTEQVLEFIQSDVDVAELRRIIATRNVRAKSRAFGIDLFVRTWSCCESIAAKASLAESFATTMKKMVLTYSSTSGSSNPVLARVHFATKLAGCDESPRHDVSEAYGKCLSEFASLLSTVTLDDASCSVIVGVLKACALDFDVEDSYLLHESRILSHVLRLLSTDVIHIRRAAQSLLGVFLGRFVVGKANASVDADDDHQQQQNEQQHPDDDVLEATAFQRQLFAAVGFQLEGVAAHASAPSILPNGPTRDAGSRDLVPTTTLSTAQAALCHYLPQESPGLTAPSMEHTRVSWNHSIMLWVFVHGDSSIYALKVGDEVRRGPDWKDASDDDSSSSIEVGVVTSIVAPTRIAVRWDETISEHVFDPKHGVFEIVLADEGVRGVIFCKGNKTMVKDTAFAAPWSSFGLYLSDQRQLSYKIARGGDGECVYNSNFELEANEWSHVAVVQSRETLKIFVNGIMASHHLLDPFLLMHGNVSASESKIIESVHPYPDAVDQYWPVHIPGATTIRVTFDPLCDIDQSTGFVRFYKNARCNEHWGDERYSGKYSDPERNFPGAQSGRFRGRRNSFSGKSSGPPTSIEIPSDRFLVYFRNEGDSNGWGFRLLAVPQFPTTRTTMGHEATSTLTSASARIPLNPFAFYFGEPPCRVLDEPAAKCSIFQPKVCDYAVLEDDITAEMQASCPSTEIVPTVLPSNRALHILSLLQTCAETPFGRSLIATPENIGNLLSLALSDSIPTVLRCASLGVLRDLVEYISPDIAAAQMQRVVSLSETSDLVTFVFAQISDCLNVWRLFDAEEVAGSNNDANDDVACLDDTGLLPLRKSAHETTNLVTAYIAILRALAGHFDWNVSIFAFVSRALTAIRSVDASATAAAGDSSKPYDMAAIGHALASCAVLGGTYGGITVGGRVTCCVNIDGKETVETGYVLQFRLKNGARTAQILFDCDRSRPIDVPVSDIAHLGDEEMAELAQFYAHMAPFVDSIKDLFGDVLAIDVVAGDTRAQYEPKVTRKENVEVLESEHPYCNDEDVTYPLAFAGAKEIVIYFDKQSCTAGANDYVTFYKHSDVDSNSTTSRSREHWGDAKYYGYHFPGVGNVPPLRIPAASVEVHFHTDSTAVRDPVEWGFKLTAHAFEETLSFPPEIPPRVAASALSDVRARCVKAISSFFRLHTSSKLLSDCATLLPALTRIANEPSDGRPTSSMPRSQVFESKHPYANSVLEYMEVTFRGASKLTVTFDAQSKTELGCDYLSFFKDRSLTERWGASQYSGDEDETANWPGVGGRAPLVIPSDSFTLFWCTDVMNVAWGWKFTVTAEFDPIAPLALSFEQLDKRAYHMFEILYEKPRTQRSPFPQEFDGFREIVGDDACTQHKWRNDPIRQCVVPRASGADGSVNLLKMRHQQQLFAVVDAHSVNVYADRRKSNVVRELTPGQHFRAQQHRDSWLEVLADDAAPGWVQQRSGDKIYVASVAALTRHENLLVLGVDDAHLDVHYAVLEMNESNDEQTALASFFSQFAFESLKSQCDRSQGFAIDAHRALATKCARGAITDMLASRTHANAIRVCDFVDEFEFLVLLTHLLPDNAAPAQTHVAPVDVLATAVRVLVNDPTNATLLSRVVDRCLQLLHTTAALLPRERGALRTVESEHPYANSSDQHWTVSIPGASRIEVTFDAKSKCEDDVAWLRFYKHGSDRTETLGASEYGGRGDNAHWPGCAGRPPLVIEADALDVHFHADSNQNDWGFKLFAIGTFDNATGVVDASSASEQSVDVISVISVLNVCCWLLGVVSETLVMHNSDTTSSHELRTRMYSTDVVDALAFGLNALPLQVQPQLLQVATNLAQRPEHFHSLSHVQVEQLRALVRVKLDAQYTIEHEHEIKSHFLQMLVQSAVALDMAIESDRFRAVVSSTGVLPTPRALTKMTPHDSDSDTVRISWIDDEDNGDNAFAAAMQHQFQVVLQTVTPPFSVVVWSKRSSDAPVCMAVEWIDNGDVRVLDVASSELMLFARLAAPLSSGDTVSIQIDIAQRMLVLRRNGLVAGTIDALTLDKVAVDCDANGTSAGVFCDFESLAMAVGARSFDAHDVVLGWRVAVSPLALLPRSVAPSWYSKLVDSVATMLAFRDSRAADIAVRESAHPLRPDVLPLDSELDNEISFPGAVALEIKLDRRTRLAATDALQFHWIDKRNDANTPAHVNLVGVHGEREQKRAPILFLSESHKRSDLARVGDLVVRSRDWDFGDEDGGVGGVGIVDDIVVWKNQTGAGVRVTWRATGHTNVYRCGFHGRFDVQRCSSPGYRDVPLVIPGDALTFSFQTTREAHKTNRAFSSTTDEFTGTLRLGAASLYLPTTITTTMTNVPSGNVHAVADDATLEMWLHIAVSEAAELDRDDISVSLIDLVQLLQQSKSDTSLRICVQYPTGAVSVLRCTVDDAGVEQRTSPLANDLADPPAVRFHTWLHLALVIAGAKLLLYQNGELIFSTRWDPRACAFDTAVLCRQSTPQMALLSPCVHVHDVRLWSAALRPEQLRSHANGLGTVSSSSSGLQLVSPTFASIPRSRFGSNDSTDNGRSPSQMFASPPPPAPSSPTRSSVTIPSGWKQWTTTNRTGKDVVTVRLSASVETLARDTDRVVYYEALALSSGKISVGWMWTHAAPLSRGFVLGESDDSFGIEPQQQLAHMRGSTSEIASFPAVARSDVRSPRRSESRSSFSNELWCRDGDVIGCALVCKTSEVQFYINGQLVACAGLHDDATGHDRLTRDSIDGSERLSSVSVDDAGDNADDDESTEQNAFDQIVDEMCSIGFSRKSSFEAVASSGGHSTSEAVSWLLERDLNAVAASSVDLPSRRRSVRSRSSSMQSTGSVARSVGSVAVGTGLSPAATLAPQGAQGVVWNFGTCAFKHPPSIGASSQLQSVIDATGCAASQLHFQVFEHADTSWQRVAHRHTLQDMPPQLLRWWPLVDGTGVTVHDASDTNGDISDRDGRVVTVEPEDSSTSSQLAIWNHLLSPPANALQRTSDVLTSFAAVDDAAIACTDTIQSPSAAANVTPSSLWGYRFYVIPHYSLETIGNERLIEQVARLANAPSRTQLRHDRHVVKYVNYVSQARHMSVSQLLRAAWSEIAPSADELVRWPVLVEIATGVVTDRGRDDPTASTAAAAAMMPPASGLESVNHERLAKRFKVLQDLNAAVHRVLPFVSLRSPAVSAPASSTSSSASSTSTIEQLCDLVAAQRHLIFHVVKCVVWDAALAHTVESSVVLELTLNRPKAMRHHSTGRTDTDARYALFAQAFRQLNALGGAHYRRTDNIYHVNFLGENAQDAGGPYRETLAQYCEELHSTQLPLLLPTPNAQHNVGSSRDKWVVHPGAVSPTLLQMYEFLGKLLGVATRSKSYLSLNIAALIWKTLVCEQVLIEDLAAIDAMLVNSMHKMRTIDTLGVTDEMFEDIVLEVFTTLSTDNRVVLLKERGDRIAVTFANRCEYADVVEHFRLHEFDAQVAAMRRGVAAVVPVKLLSCFSGAELELMVCGSPEVDVDLLQRCTEYSSCSATDQHIVWFWSVLRGFSHPERSAFLRFVWGRARLPAHESEFAQRFKLQSFNKAVPAGLSSVDAYLPVAHTCFFAIEMPAYSSEAVLRAKLLYAIYNCQEIDGDGDAVMANQLGWEE